MKSIVIFLRIFWPVLVCALLAVGCGGAFLAWRANAQAKLWQSQGIEISAFEVFIGIRPAGTPGGAR